MLFRKERYEEITVSRMILALLLVIAVYAFIFSDRGYINYRRLQNKEVRLNEEIRELEIRKMYMEERISSLRRSKYLYESIAREKLEMVKPDETVYQLEYIEE